jgi:NADH-quinone oxidoreductase subunit G
MPINLEIDGKPVTVDNGATVMDGATKLGIFVPHFCYHKKLSIAANCRMCLVQVEKAPKPLPACATPATEGMKVHTQSEPAKQAQKGVMEFLLINHPLDCPICDQGGECQLQDLAVGYGGSSSRYKEEKRVVVNKNLGPLISTDMTRCIHCTRCVRFGQEIAGIMELGMAGRGEHSEILSFVGRTVDSELSGNVIDLCPVGALTSKPFRYSARNWELSRRRSVSGHDSLGSTIMVQSKQDRVMRVLPIENEAINECWLSDRDRFAYEGLNSEERLVRPMVKRAGEWVEVDWPEALQAAVDGLKDVTSRHGGGELGVLLAPHLTLEEMHLAAKLGRALGTDNIDFRVRQRDFRLKTKGAPWLGTSISELAKMESVLVVGSTLRKEQPLIAARLRGAAKRGMAVSTVHVAKDDLLIPTAMQVAARPGDLVGTLAAVAAAAVRATGKPVRGDLKRAITPEEEAIAARLVGKRSAILLGQYAQQHPDYAVLLSIAQEIGRITGATVGVLPDGANGVGGYLVNALPVKGGKNAREMIESPRTGYIVAGVEAELDMGPQALAAIAQSEFTVALSAYRNATTDRAHVMLPIAPFTETAGTFVNMEGRAQSFLGLVKPVGDARPGWKVLRVLGTMLGLDGFDAEQVEEVRADIAPELTSLAEGRLSNEAAEFDWQLQASPHAVERIAEFAIYAMDPTARRSRPLQLTNDMKRARMARMSAGTAAQLSVREGDRVRVRQGNGEALLNVGIDAAVPEGCVRVARGIAETAALGEGALEVHKAEMAAVA